MVRTISPEENEKITFALRSLYASYGYAHYKMSKFEEYDLYSENKDFLVSDGVITFTDTNGRLMALKPDVTLSIVKNTERSAARIQKLYYNENVYRVSKSTRSFRELMQVGLECIGDVDDLCIYEVLTLAQKSLLSISEKCVLDVSDLDILREVIEYVGIPLNGVKEIFRLIGEKNYHEITEKCAGYGIAEEKTSVLRELIALHGTPEAVFAKTDVLLSSVVTEKTYAGFKNIISQLMDKNIINIDFSVTDDINYYNGIVFKGFIEGVPNSVLSGGRYDSLMRKMNRRAGAIGFAVYIDMLERLMDGGDKNDADTVLVYGENDDFADVQTKADELRESGERVLVVKTIPEGLRFGKRIDFGGEA